MAAILAKKLGMTQVFLEDGRVERVTVLEAGPCPVTAVRSHDADGYEAVQLGYGATTEKRLTRAELGHLKKADASAHRHLVEFRDEAGELQVGATVTVSPTVSSPASSRNSRTWRSAGASAFLRWPSSAFVSRFSLTSPNASCTAS